jgi:hypothetical protein
VTGLPAAPSELTEGKAHHAAETSLAEGNQLFLEDLSKSAKLI